MASFFLGLLLGGCGGGYIGYLYAKNQLPWTITKNNKNPYG